ncbi:hypothetical protein ACXAUS_004048 [Clostridium sporogenes]|uniref:hypothetical protein n=1 Tax=Clostridium sporogenes TaxID=1509 RepID=UPI0028FF9931|nr:hypothetical protein [Clostridium botulinum]
MLRNFIDIIGITKEEDLPSKINGQIIQYSEVDYIDIPEDKPKINDIYQIAIKADIKSTRTINAPTGKIVVVDGEKNFKIIYSEKSASEKANILNLKLPFNTFIDIEDKQEEIKKIDIYILDVYFQIVTSEKLYSYVLYMINVQYCNVINNKFLREDENCLKDIKFVQVKDEEYVYTNKFNNVFEEVSMSQIKESYENDNISYDKYNEKQLVDIDSEYL